MLFFYFQKHKFLPSHHSISFGKFLELYKTQTLRSEIKAIFNEISPDNSYLTAKELYKFVHVSKPMRY